jgi:hypothetical protein
MLLVIAEALRLFGFWHEEATAGTKWGDYGRSWRAVACSDWLLT